MDKHRAEMFVWLMHKLDLVENTRLDYWSIFRGIAKTHNYEDNMAAKERSLGYAARLQQTRLKQSE